jgi:formylglycine-generating enzyme required for sulfatase activity
MKRKLYLVCISALILSLAFFACDDGGENPPGGNPPGGGTTLAMQMVNISAGTLTKPNNNYWTASFDTVTISAFKIGKYEVTQEQYHAVTGNNPSNFSSSPASGEVQGKRPVESVTWYDAVEFCNKLSEMEGLASVYTITGRTPATGYPITIATVTADFSKNGYRLPTEAQWQYAAQGGGSTTVTVTDATGWYSDNSDSMTHEVGKKSANAYGLHDMLGNVWEWCWDWYQSTYPSGASDPTGAVSGDGRVIRGGSWSISAVGAASAGRGGSYPVVRNSNGGFRLARPN